MFVEEKKAGEAKVLEPWRQQLLEAANLLEKDGWCQHTCKNALGERCILGALGEVIKPDLGAMGTYRWMTKKLHTFIDMAVTEWNDQPGRTKAEVLALLRQTAAKEA